MNKQSNVADYDLVCKDGSKISVKLISPENKSGRITRLGTDWDEFILIILDNKYKVSRLGQINKSQFRKILKDKSRSQTPYVSRAMLKDRRLFDKYGKIFQGNDVKNLI